MLKCRLGTYDNRQTAACLSAIAAAVALTLSIHAPAVADGEQITQARCDIGRSNAVADNLPLPLTMVWKSTTVAVPKTTQAPLYANGIIYFAMAKNVYAVRASDGTTLWTFSGKDNFNSPGALSNGALFIGSDDSHLYKISLKDGSVIWSTAASAQIRSAPAVANGRVYFGDENGDVYGVDAQTGKVLWNVQAGGAVSSPIAVSDNDKLFFAAADSNVYCLSGSTGHLDWQLLFSADLSGTPPCFANDSLYVAAGRELYALNPNHGALRWRAHFGGDITTPPTVGPDNVFVCTDDNRVQALNDHGGLLWTSKLGVTATAAPFLAGNTVLVSTINGAIFGFDANSGARNWDYVIQPTGTHAKAASVSLNSSPIFADNALYVLADDGSLNAFHPQTIDQAGPVIYSVTPAPGTTVSAPALNLAAKVVDEGSGVAPTSLKLTIDGQPVTAVAYDPATNGMRTTVDPLALPGPNTPELPTLKNGAHTAVLTIADWKGNVATRTWSFRIIDGGAKTAAEQAVEDNQTIVAQPDNTPPDNAAGAPTIVTGPGVAGGRNVSQPVNGQGTTSRTGNAGNNGNAGNTGVNGYPVGTTPGRGPVYGRRPVPPPTTVSPTPNPTPTPTPTPSPTPTPTPTPTPGPGPGPISGPPPPPI